MSTADEWDQPIGPIGPIAPAGPGATSADDGTGAVAVPGAEPARLPTATDMQADRRRRQVQIEKKRTPPMVSILGGLGLIVLGVVGSILLYIGAGFISGYLIVAPVIGLVMIVNGLIRMFQRPG
ncbi:MAG: hypothetical protein ACREJ2_04525 [Planctomycetota bacterium]